MAAPGREPTANPVNRNTPMLGWTDVPNVPYKGKPPVTLPLTRTVDSKDGAEEQPLHPLTQQWWKLTTTMPHCAVWSTGEWLLAVATALIADALFNGSTTVAAEFRRREQELGTTEEARRKLRIRYVEPVKPAPKPRASRAKSSTLAPVTQIDERWKRALEEN